MAEIQALILYCSLFISLFFEVFLLITYLEVREELDLEEKYLGKNIREFPTVTIIVPCFNEEKNIPFLLADFGREIQICSWQENTAQ